MFRSSSAMPFFRIAVIRGVRLHRTNRQSVSSVRDDFSFLPPRAEHPIRFVRRSSCLATFPASRPPPSPRPDRCAPFRAVPASFRSFLLYARERTAPKERRPSCKGASAVSGTWGHDGSVRPSPPTIPCRGTACISCRCRRGRDRCVPPSFRRAEASASVSRPDRPVRRPACAKPATC